MNAQMGSEWIAEKRLNLVEWEGGRTGGSLNGGGCVGERTGKRNVKYSQRNRRRHLERKKRKPKLSTMPMGGYSLRTATDK